MMIDAYVYLRPCRMEVPKVRNGRPGYTWVQGREIVYLTGPKRGHVVQAMRLQEARDYCKANNLITSLPSIGDVQAYTQHEAPHFFTRSSRKFHDTGRAHRLCVVRMPNGAIGVTNGRSYWEFVSESDSLWRADLRYILDPLRTHALGCAIGLKNW